MNHFQVDIYEVKPIPAYVLKGQINLHSGKSLIDEKQTGEGLVFERIHASPKTKLTFTGAERKEGLLYYYFIVLDNAHSYLYIIGETNERPIIRGGAFIEVDAEDGKDIGAIITKYIEGNAKRFAGLYAKTDSPALIDALNNSVSQLLDLIP